MNSGGAYNKGAKRKTTSLLLARTNSAGGAVGSLPQAVDDDNSINNPNRRNEHGGGHGGGRGSAKVGQLQLQSVPRVQSTGALGTNNPNHGQHQQRNGQRGADGRSQQQQQKQPRQRNHVSASGNPAQMPGRGSSQDYQTSQGDQGSKSGQISGGYPTSGGLPTRTCSSGGAGQSFAGPTISQRAQPGNTLPINRASQPPALRNESFARGTGRGIIQVPPSNRGPTRAIGQGRMVGNKTNNNSNSGGSGYCGQSMYSSLSQLTQLSQSPPQQMLRHVHAAQQRQPQAQNPPQQHQPSAKSMPPNDSPPSQSIAIQDQPGTVRSLPPNDRQHEHQRQQTGPTAVRSLVQQNGARKSVSAKLDVPSSSSRSMAIRSSVGGEGQRTSVPRKPEVDLLASGDLGANDRVASEGGGVRTELGDTQRSGLQEQCDPKNQPVVQVEGRGWTKMSNKRIESVGGGTGVAGCAVTANAQGNELEASAPRLRQQGGHIVHDRNNVATATPNAHGGSSSTAATPITVAGAGSIVPDCSTATAGETEAALRARLAQIEARNAEILAQVEELEERNFDLEAAVQLVEVEASRRVEQESKALQSKLSFRDHQLTVAQSNHTMAMKELTAEKGRRKRDRQEAERGREEAAAKTEAAIAAACAAAANAAAAAAAAEQKALSERAAMEKSRKDAATAEAKRRAAAGGREDARPSISTSTLVELILSDLADEVLVLLSASGAGVLEDWGGGERDAMVDNGDWTESYIDIAAGDRGGGWENSWLCTPLGVGLRRRRRVASFSSSVAPDSAYSANRGSRDSGNRGIDNGAWRTGDDGRKGDFRGTSPLSLAFTPVRSSGGGAPTGSGLREGEQSLSPALAAIYGGSGGWRQTRGPPSTAGSCADAWGAYNLSPRCSGDGRDAEDNGRGRVEILRFLSSHMFICVTELVDGEACAGDLLDVLAAFLEELPGETEDELVVLVSAVRLIHRTLSVTQPAAAAVAAGGAPEAKQNWEAAEAAAVEEGTLTTIDLAVPSSSSSTTGSGLVRSGSRLFDSAADISASSGKGKGKRSRRPGSADNGDYDEGNDPENVEADDDCGLIIGHVDDGDSEAEAAVRGRNDDVVHGRGSGGGGGGRHDGEGKRGKKRQRRVPPSSPPLPTASTSCAIFIAGKPWVPQDPRNVAAPAGVSLTVPSRTAPTLRSEGAPGEHRGGVGRTTLGFRDGTKGGISWATKRGGGEIGSRLKRELIAVFHRGVFCGYPTLVEASLQAIQSALWDANDNDVALWGGLLEGDSLQEVMLSDLHRSSWELGAQLLGVLVRNPSLFQSLAAAALAPDEPHPSSAIGEQGLTAGGGAGEGRASASKSVVTEVTAPPTPPSETAIVRMVGGGGGQGGGGDGDGECEDGDAAMGVLGESFLRRLCLDAVTTGEHASFGENASLRLAIIRLAFFACHRYGADAANALLGEDGKPSGAGGWDGESGVFSAEDEVGSGLVPALVHFVRLELEDWERRRYSQTNPIVSDRARLLKEAFQLLWVLAMHAPLPLKDMAQGAAVFNTMVNVVSRFYNSAEMEEFQVHKEAMMLMELMN